MSSKDQFYQRQVTLKEVGKAGQEKLANSRVLVIGAGGLGCPVLEYLTAAGVGQITICDFDKVDYTNLHRQVLYSPEDVGFYKAQVAASRLQKQNPHIHIEVITKRYDLNFDISAFDLLIDCSDNFETKFMLHDHCYQNNTALIQASIHKFEGQIQVFQFQQNKESRPCLRCLWPLTPAKSCVQTCSEAGVLGVVPGVIGSMQAAEAIKCLLDLPTLKTGETLLINLFDFSSQKIAWPKQADCPLCSHENHREINLTYGDSSLEIQFDQINPDEYQTINLSNNTQDIFKKAINCDLENIETLTQKISRNKNLLLFCNRGITSLKATQKLRSLGFANCYSLKDGIAHLK